MKKGIFFNLCMYFLEKSDIFSQKKIFGIIKKIFFLFINIFIDKNNTVNSF